TGRVGALLVVGDELFVGGWFGFGGQSTGGIAAWDGAAWRPVGHGIDGEVDALASYGGDVYAGGGFCGSWPISAAYIARWDGARHRGRPRGGAGGPAGAVSAGVRGLSLGGGSGALRGRRAFRGHRPVASARGDGAGSLRECGGAAGRRWEHMGDRAQRPDHR